ncbi:hypothetical protein BJP25_26425 [Actinokineospora bangkokensis]|uniref:DUF3558 domain-containing protein n=1 Tax=Actinokineospora bangkokensis TaxID=1193682 RepID=A0A1Q9LH51_9PSEU|nr:hypothetical protein BJP25_26425 [Actinokineospora bangkokensis]
MAVAGGLVAVLAACGTDLARSSGPRSTVPAAEGLAGPATTGTPQPGGGDAFSAASLRRVNPCGLLDEEVLAQFGTPARSRLRDFGLCSNYMKDPAGRDLNFTLTVGDSSLARKPEGSLKVGGLPTAESELDDKSACFLTAITETNPSRGITIQLGSDTPGGLCDPARKVLESAVNEVRDAKPPLEVQKGSLVDLDPCTTLDDATITTAIGDGATKNPTSLHTCAYNNRGVALRLDFTISNDPDDLAEAAETTPVDLGGIRAQQKSEVRSSARCELSWAHVKFEGAEGTSEVVNLDFTRYQPQAGEDPCTTLQAVAKALIPKLPQT